MVKKDNKMVKVVYFDEGSATDFIYVLEGGKNTDKKEHIVTKATEFAVGAEAAAGKSSWILSLFAGKLGADANADFSREGNTIITKAIENVKDVHHPGLLSMKAFALFSPSPFPSPTRTFILHVLGISFNLQLIVII